MVDSIPHSITWDYLATDGLCEECFDIVFNERTGDDTAGETQRRYIEERYGFNAMEMTSSEIIDRLMSTDDPKSLEEMKQLFNTADLVKFAKYSTLINENDANLVNAVEFINQTKIDAQVPQTTVKEELTADEIRSKNSRLALQIAITVLSVLSLLSFGYVLYSIYILI